MFLEKRNALLHNVFILLVYVRTKCNHEKKSDRQNGEHMPRGGSNWREQAENKIEKSLLWKSL